MPAYEKVEGREGILVVHDSVTGEYVGCLGREIWHRLLGEDEPATTLEDQGFAVEWVEVDPSHERLIEPSETHRKCRRIGCLNPVAWALLRGFGNGSAWWFYCADHHYGRKIEDGKLLHRCVVPNTGTERPAE